MKLIWYGTASLILQEEDTTIAFDPFCGMPEGGFGRRYFGNARASTQALAARKNARASIRAYRRASDIFVTHGHFDHIYHIPAIYRKLPVTVYCTAAPRRTLQKHGFPVQRRARHMLRRKLPGSPIMQKIQEIGPGWEGTVGPFTIAACQGRHCRFDLPLLKNTVLCRRFWRHPLHLLHILAADLTFPEKGEILFYEVTCQERRIQIMGSMNLDTHTEYPTGADVLILPLQGRSDQDTYALDIVRRLQPKSILLDHYDNAFPPLTNDIDTSVFVRNVREQLGIPCRPLEKYKEIIL